ncbi:ArsR family transcriptional regulator [Membranihabitans marinus]|uniref:ArsR family transcriptional regulator n=1 Tax=Membranihabitans marinus TaxID=1227546 RepID=UPI001F1C5C80|nr:ArsR family transcriptional regulator [Membranihabitans marinus]
MIEALISSKTRIKLLLKFFLNSNTSSYLRSLESEFEESSNGIRKELNRLESAGLLSSFFEGNKKIFQANTQHPLFKEINNIVRKQVGIDKIISNVVKKLGSVNQVYVLGEFAKGRDSDIIDILLIGAVDEVYLIHLISKVEKIIQRKVRYLILEPQEALGFMDKRNKEDFLLIWEQGHE